MTRSNQKGFAVIEAILVVIIIFLVGFTSWFVLHAKQITNNSYSAATTTTNTSGVKMYTDTTGTFSLQYPANWRLSLAQDGGEGKPPDWKTFSRPLTLAGPNAPETAPGVQVHVIPMDQADAQVAQNRKDTGHAQVRKLINGHTAAYTSLSYTGPSNAEKYHDETYYIYDGKQALQLSFRADYYHAYPAENWSDVADAVGYHHIVSSVHFLK